MNVLRSLLLFVLSVALLVTLVSANLAVATDRTVMDADYAAEAANEANVSSVVVEQIETELSGDLTFEEDALPIDLSAGELVSASVTESYVEGEVEANLDRLYAYLSGDADELRLEVDTAPVKENAADVVEDELSTLGPGDVDDEYGQAIEEMAESESQFLAHREAFEADAKAKIQAETSRELSDEELERAYEERREEIREAARDAANERVDEAFARGELPPSFEEPVRTLALARIDALTRAIDYETYVDRVDGAMADLRAAVLTEFEAALDEHVPETIDLAEELNGESTQPLEDARTATSATSTLALGLPALALVLVGVVGWLASASGAALTVGANASVAGLVGVAGARFADGFLGEALASADLPSVLASFVEQLVGGWLGALAWQSGAVLAGGVGLVGVGLAIRFDVILADRD